MDGAGGTLLLISDGHANAGVIDPEQLGAVAAKAAADGITTTTVGFGLGYDERLLKAIAAGGNGSELFAEHADRPWPRSPANSTGCCPRPPRRRRCWSGWPRPVGACG